MTGWAAAFVHGADTLDGANALTGRLDPVMILLGRDVGRRPQPGVVFSRDRLPDQERTRVHGVPVTTPARAAFDGVRMPANLAEAVGFLDATAAALRITLPQVRAFAGQRRGWRGAGQVTAALELADPAARSTWETRLRLFYHLDARLPRPLVNRPVFDLDGNFLGIPDLLDPEAGLVTEFDGQDHRLREQHRRDNVREEKLEGAGLVVCRADSLDLLHHRSELAGRLRARYAQGCRRNRKDDRWTLDLPAWWVLRSAS